MAKEKTKTEESKEVETEETGAPESLSEVRLPSRIEGEDDVTYDQEATMIMEDVHTMGGLMLAYQSNISPEDGVFVHTFFKHLEEYGKMGKEAIKEPLIAAALAADENGEVVTSIGKVKATVVEAGTSKVFTPATRDLLEAEGILPNCAEMSATMKRGVDIEKISDEHLEVIEQYFDIEYVLSPSKVNAQIELGNVDAEAVEATQEEQQTRAGYTRLSVTPTKELRDHLGIETVEKEKS